MVGLSDLLAEKVMGLTELRQSGDVVTLMRTMCGASTAVPACTTGMKKTPSARVHD